MAAESLLFKRPVLRFTAALFFSFAIFVPYLLYFQVVNRLLVFCIRFLITYILYLHGLNLIGLLVYTFVIPFLMILYRLSLPIMSFFALIFH